MNSQSSRWCGALHSIDLRAGRQSSKCDKNAEFGESFERLCVTSVIATT